MLRLIAAGGADAFYRSGAIAGAIVESVRRAGGVMTEDDLASHDSQKALDRSRFCIDSGEAGGIVRLEEGVPEDIVGSFRARGQPLESDIPSFRRALFGRG